MDNIAVVFPGQGVQYVGMGKDVYEKHPFVKDIFDKASVAAGFNVSKMCFESDEKNLTNTTYLQPCLVTVSVALYNVMQMEFGITPRLLAGNSLGEISALICSGAIKFEDGIEISKYRGRYMGEIDVDGAMAAINGINPETILEKTIEFSTNENYINVSNFNSPTQTVISGMRLAVDELCAIFESMGATTVHLKTSAPFHTRLMMPAGEKFKDLIKNYKFNNINIPVISNVTAIPYAETDSIYELLPLQIVDRKSVV